MRERGYGFGGGRGHATRERTQLRGPDEWEDRDWQPRARAGGPVGPQLPVIAAGGCWCGEHLDHDWPGKDAGAAHPR